MNVVLTIRGPISDSQTVNIDFGCYLIFLGASGVGDILTATDHLNIPGEVGDIDIEQFTYRKKSSVMLQ